MSFVTDNPALFAANQQVYSPYALPNGTEPLVFADFKNGVYTLDGDVVALGDIIEGNADYTGWDPDLINLGVGLADPTNTGDGNFQLKPIVHALLGGGFTSVAICTGVAQLTVRGVDFPDYNYFASNSVGFVSGDIVLSVSDGSGSLTDTFAGTIAKAVFSFTQIRSAGSANGRAVVGMDVPGMTAPPNTSVISISQGMILESIGWYPLQEEADLPMLSAP